MAKYAEVAVEVPARPRVSGAEPSEETRGPRLAAFHYLVPPRIESRLRLGQWVWVPFGARNLSGIVVALGSQPPDVELREVSDVIDERPVLSEAQLALGRWISDYYLAPLFDCLCLFLPPGASPRVETLYRLVPRELPRLTPNQQRIVALLQQHGALTRARLERLLYQSEQTGAKRKRALRGLRSLDTLVRRNVLESFTRLASPRQGPSLRETVRLLVSAEEAWRRLAALVARTGPARALILLAEAQEGGDPLLSTADLMRESRLSARALAELEAKGLVTLAAGTTVHAAAVGQAEGPTGPPPEALAALDCLRARGPLTSEELALSGHEQPALDWLLRQGLAEARRTPGLTSLALSATEARQRALDVSRKQGPRRALAALLDLPAQPWLSDLLRQAACTRAALRHLVDCGIVTLERRRFYRDPLVGLNVELLPPVSLSPTQAEALEPVLGAAREHRQESFLLHGVTGSGKTEMYLRAIEQVLGQGRQAIVLVPEIALTPQAIRRFSARFAGRIAVQHSGLGEGERYDQWSQIRDGAADIVIGSRSALFAPLPRHGLIIVDEEHERSYKQEERPHYHARDAALELGRLTGSVVILGSATPDVCTYRAAERGELHLLALPWRYGHVEPLPLPPVQVVDMRQELREGRTGLLSLALYEALAEALAHSEQAILFLNRRGSATFVMCRDCGYVALCPRCSLPLTYHLIPMPDARVGDARRGVTCNAPATTGERLATPNGGATRNAPTTGGAVGAGGLACHHCSYRAETPLVCPQCGSARIRHFGAGTERLQAYVQTLFPRARVVRWDRDTTRGKGGHDAILERFLSHEADVLVGTQMVAKGLDLPLVTLVGAVAADTALFLPDYRAGERAFQLLAQVVGRAGRGERGGRAIIQTYHPDHYAIQAASRHDYESFYRQEIDRRWQLAYPPFGQMIRLLYSAADDRRCRSAAQQLASRLRLRIRQLGLPNLEVMGPSPCFYARLRGRYRWHIILRGHGGQELLRDEPLPLGWRVDVDPVSFL